ncbi:MAG: CtsR family transcriptional regulator [Eubacteriales bacterium]
MNLSSNITNLILQMLERDGYTEIQRNELAQSLGCVPSQINYVIASRFTPEQGYIVESRRGGGGYIRISRVKLDRGAVMMHVINTIGQSLDEKTCRAHILNLTHQTVLDTLTAKLMLVATADNSLRSQPPEIRDKTRANILKNMLLTVT